MVDEDLYALLGMLKRRQPDAKITINDFFVCSVDELKSVVEEAIVAREHVRLTWSETP
jgi:hypothetical protein